MNAATPLSSKARTSVVDAGVFPALRYRLTARDAQVMMRAFATCDLTWVGEGQLRVQFSHGPDHWDTSAFLAARAPGEEVTVECWSPVRFGERRLWDGVRVSAHLDHLHPQGFVGYSALHQGDFKVFSASPPEVVGITPLRAA